MVASELVDVRARNWVYKFIWKLLLRYYKERNYKLIGERDAPRWILLSFELRFSL